VGHFDHKLGAEEILDLSQHKIEIVLGEAEIAKLEEADPAAAGLAVTVRPVELTAAVPRGIAEGASILCVEVDARVPRSLARIADLRADHPELPIIALVRDADVTLVRALLRQGVNDVVDLPLSIRQLTESAGGILGALSPKAAPSGRKAGQLIAVVKSIGGVGATNAAVHIATGLEGACLFDLDVQFGTAATYLGAPSEPSLSQLLDGGVRVDGEFLRTVATRVAGGASLVPAPPEIRPIEAVDDMQMRRILRTARGEFDHVVVDLPANWANWSLAAAAEADIVILVITLSIASLRQGKRQIQLLRDQGVDPAKILVLVNRVEQRLFKTIGLDDAAKALGHPVTLSVHNDYPLMSAANNQGILVGELGKRSKIARDYARIAETIAEMAQQAVR